MKLNQKGEDGSTNYQATEITIVNGITVTEARQIAVDVFKSNFMIMKEEANEVATNRAIEITEKFLDRLHVENKEALVKFNQPDMQSSLYNVQKIHAINGDETMGDLLVDLLIDRTKEESRTIIQIVLDESIKVVPLLTEDQIATLSLSFLLRYTINQTISSIDTMKSYLNTYIQPLNGYLTNKNSCFTHLEFTSCANIQTGEIKIATIFKNNYGGVFSKGFNQEEFAKFNIDIELHKDYIINCLRDNNKFQINAINLKFLEDKLEKENYDDSIKNGLKSLYNSSLMNDKEVLDSLLEMAPFMEQVIDIWNNTSLKNLTLTSVGIAIGHANMKKALGEFVGLEIWIS